MSKPKIAKRYMNKKAEVKALNAAVDFNGLKTESMNAFFMSHLPSELRGTTRKLFKRARKAVLKLNKHLDNGRQQDDNSGEAASS